MIGWLKGHIIDKHHPGKLVIDVHGVGYDVETSLPTFFQLETHLAEVGLHIHTIVREDAFLLYGFLDQQERALFRALIKVNGVGPKMAIAILSSLNPDEFIQCIYQKNTALLTKIPGVGNKTAQRLLVELKDNLDHLSQLNKAEGIYVQDLKHHQGEAIKALEALGYKTQEAVKAIKKIDDGSKTCEQLIRQALQVLSL